MQDLAKVKEGFEMNEQGNNDPSRQAGQEGCKGKKTNSDKELSAEQKQERRRSNVRVRVTYGVAAAYCFGALGMILWLMIDSKHDIAIGVFSGVAGVASSVIGYWFGSRQHTKPQPQHTPVTE
jgi:hypothetical protein